MDRAKCSGCHMEVMVDEHRFARCANCGQETQYNNNGQPPMIVKRGGDPNVKLKPSATAVLEKPATIPAAPAPVQPAPTNGPKPVPPKPIGRGLPITRYYDANRAAILDDFKKLDLEAMLKRWNIHIVQWRKLKKRWGVAKTPENMPNNIPKTASSEAKPETKSLESDTGKSEQSTKTVILPSTIKSLIPLKPTTTLQVNGYNKLSFDLRISDCDISKLTEDQFLKAWITMGVLMFKGSQDGS